MRALHTTHPNGLSCFCKQNSFAQIMTTFGLWMEYIARKVINR